MKNNVVAVVVVVVVLILFYLRYCSLRKLVEADNLIALIRVCDYLNLSSSSFEPPHGKTNNLHRRKQRRRSASQ